MSDTKADLSRLLSQRNKRILELEAAARLARRALDNLMGDTDDLDEYSDEMKAMMALARALKVKP